MGGLLLGRNLDRGGDANPQSPYGQTEGTSQGRKSRRFGSRPRGTPGKTRFNRLAQRRRVIDKVGAIANVWIVRAMTGSAYRLSQEAGDIFAIPSNSPFLIRRWLDGPRSP